MPSLATYGIRMDAETNFAARLGYCKIMLSLGRAGQQHSRRPSNDECVLCSS